MGSSSLIKMLYCPIDNIANLATARIENIQLNGLLFTYDLYYNPQSTTRMDPGQYIMIDIIFRNIINLN